MVADVVVQDGRIAAERYDAEPGCAYLLRPDGYVARQVELWRKQWDRVKTCESAP